MEIYIKKDSDLRSYQSVPEPVQIEDYYVLNMDENFEASLPPHFIYNVASGVLEEDSVRVAISNRRVEYPSLEDQADIQYWDAINGTTIWLDMITAIKVKYPKGDR